MKFNRTTYNLSIATMIFFGMYTLIYSGMAGLLLTIAISLISAAFINQFEIVTGITIIFGLFYIYFLSKYLKKLEPFENKDTPVTIAARVENMSKAYKPTPQGVYNPAIEGFEDTQPDVPKEGASSQSTAATSKRSDEVKLPKEMSDKSEKSENEEFKSAGGSLFKLGQLPTEAKDGPHIDSGSTLLKAMESLKPDQITSMTDDTKKLIETQKNLMSMLGQMKPVLQDGKQLLDTFSGMFGGGGGMFKL
jgi:hypothetical protein